MKIPVAHVEAGIRQKPKDMPEEINRVLTDHVSSLLFCPSELAVKNLKREGIEEGVYFVGDVMYDLFLKMKPHFKYEKLEELNLKENEYIVCTIHRDFNTDVREKLETILQQLEKVGKEKKIVFPIHPRTKKKITKYGLEKYTKDLIITEPLDYLNMMGIVEKSAIVITDSGGLQKETYWCRKRAVVVMEDTGWRELIENGWNKLAEPEEIYEKTEEVLREGNTKYPNNVYGNGDSSKKILDVLRNAHIRT